MGPHALAILLVATSAARGADTLETYADTLRARAGELKQSPAQLRWQQIPWLTDLNEGLRLARQEQRPLLLWLSGDDPLGRC